MALFLLFVLALVAIVFSQRKSPKRFWSALAVAASLVLAISIYSFPHCVTADGISRVAKGMRREEVVGLLGQPIAENKFARGGLKMCYGKPFRYCTVDVSLNSSGRVAGVFHDH